MTIFVIKQLANKQAFISLVKLVFAGLGFQDPSGFVEKYERFTYEKSNGINFNLIDQAGYKYNKKRENRWTCQKKSKGCKVILKTDGGFIVAQRFEHTCLMPW